MTIGKAIVTYLEVTVRDENTYSSEISNAVLLIILISS